MRVESPRCAEQFSSVRINDVQRILVLDSSRTKGLPLHENITVQKIEEDAIKITTTPFGFSAPKMTCEGCGRKFNSLLVVQPNVKTILCLCSICHEQWWKNFTRPSNRARSQNK
jgi:hypothetical protein